MNKPRSGEFANMPGHYEIAIRTSQAVVDPSECCDMEIYFTGYGEIDSYKLALYPSSGFFDLKQSKLISGIYQEDGKTFFGGEELDIDPIGMSLHLAALKNKDWEKPTLFIDAPDAKPPRVITETSQKNPPVKLQFVIDKKARPGTHYVQFAFTYFNGKTWKVSSRTTKITVRNFFQRHEGFAWTLATAAAVSTIIVAALEITRG